MQFSVYSELQTWPGKTQQQIYAEALEQVVNAADPGNPPPRERRPPRLLNVLNYRALLFPKIWRLAESVRLLRKMLGANTSD